MPEPINEHVEALFFTIVASLGRAMFGTINENDVLMAANGHLLVVVSVDRPAQTVILQDTATGLFRQYHRGTIRSFVNLTQHWGK